MGAVGERLGVGVEQEVAIDDGAVERGLHVCLIAGELGAGEDGVLGGAGAEGRCGEQVAGGRDGADVELRGR